MTTERGDLLLPAPPRANTEQWLSVLLPQRPKHTSFSPWLCCGTPDCTECKRDQGPARGHSGLAPRGEEAPCGLLGSRHRYMCLLVGQSSQVGW